jgi:hypothetical protein
MGYDGAEIQAWAESAASTYWWPLLGWAAGAAAVVSCTAFEPSTHVRCRRACLDRDVSSLEVRRQS